MLQTLKAGSASVHRLVRRSAQNEATPHVTGLRTVDKAADT
jgi:hypothetical protein